MRSISWMKKMVHVDDSKERFIKLLNTTFRIKITWKMLESDTDPHEWVVSGLLLHKTHAFREAEKSLKNMQVIIGDNVIATMMLRNFRPEKIVYTLYNHSEMRKKWLTVQRGRDLFYLWKFDIKKTIESLIKNVGVDRFFFPHEIAAHAYGMSQWMLTELLHYDWLVEYVKRWKQWWECDNRLARIDEIVMSFRYENQIVQAVSQDYRFTYREFDHSTHPQELLNRRNRINTEYELYNEVRYGLKAYKAPSMDDVYEVPSQFQGRMILDHRLWPIESYKDLVEVGQSLENCAASYHHDIMNGKSVLVVMVDADSQPIALGQYIVDRMAANHGKWQQVSMIRNSRASKLVMDAFTQYANLLTQE